jgi:alkylation response protein AidB-like acyl-CoA dehydrogenase
MSLTQSKAPWAESPWVSGSPSPYYTKKSHATLREYVREWSEKHVSNDLAIELDRKGITDDQLYKKFTKDGFLIPFALGFTIPKKFFRMCGGQKLPGNVNPEDWDAFHDMIMIDELSRQGSMGALFCCYAGLSYGAGPIIHFASDQVQNKFLPDLFTGKKRICLAVTEPRAGSDVGRIWYNCRSYA